MLVVMQFYGSTMVNKKLIIYSDDPDFKPVAIEVEVQQWKVIAEILHQNPPLMLHVDEAMITFDTSFFFTYKLYKVNFETHKTQYLGIVTFKNGRLAERLNENHTRYYRQAYDHLM
jgi:hypothetical protein